MLYGGTIVDNDTFRKYSSETKKAGPFLTLPFLFDY
jgi:hypothetical protein